MRVLARCAAVLAVAGAMSAPVASVGAAPGGGGSPAHRAANPGFGHVGTVVTSDTETDLATGVVTTFTLTEEYDNRGREIRSLEEESVDGAVVYRREVTASFGDDGTETLVFVDDSDGDGDSPADVIVSTFAYDNRGNLMAVHTTYDYGSDGTIDETDHETYTRDQRGRELTIHIERGDELVEDVTYTYDRRGNPTSVEDVHDFLDDPGAPDEKFVGTSQYDVHGNVLSGADESYVYDDAGVASLTGRDTFTSVYNRSGQRVGEHSTSDFDGDGTVDAVSDAVLTYDQRGNLTSIVDTRVVGGVTTVLTDLQTWDHRGNRLTLVSEERTDGQLTYRWTESDTFDTRGRFTGHTESEDEDGDGVVDWALTQVVTAHDSLGRVVAFHTTEEDGAGQVLAVHDVTIEWFRYHQVRTSYHDDDNDGSYDRLLVRVVPLL